MDTKSTNYALISMLNSKLIIEKKNPVTYMKTCENKAKMEKMRRVYIVDGVAMVHFIL